MMTNMRDSYGLIKIDREATRLVIVSATQSVQREDIFNQKKFSSPSL